MITCHQTQSTIFWIQHCSWLQQQWSGFWFAGWDKNFGFQLYQSDPSGNYGGWKATAIGWLCFDLCCLGLYDSGGVQVQIIKRLSRSWSRLANLLDDHTPILGILMLNPFFLSQEYKDNMELGDAIKLAIKVWTSSFCETWFISSWCFWSQVLNKSMDSTSLTSEKREYHVDLVVTPCCEQNLCSVLAVELATVSRTADQLDYKILDNATVDAALKELDLAQPAPENAWGSSSWLLCGHRALFGDVMLVCVYRR